MLTAAAFGVLAGAMLVFPAAAAEAALSALSLWARAVAPVLGPFMACMLMLASRLAGARGLLVPLGWLCGSPGGARLMIQAGVAGRAALRAAAMTGTMSPMFFVGTVGGWLHSPRLGWAMLACHVTGALLLGLCIKPEENQAPLPPRPVKLGEALRESALALLTVALCMALGSVAARMAACALPGLPAEAAAALQCALEVTAGVKEIAALGSPSAPALICAACSFGGLSLLLQNAAFWQERGVGLLPLFLLRLAHGLLSGLLCAAVLELFSFR